MNKNSHTGSNPGKLTSACWIQTNTSRIVFSLSRAALNTIFVLLRANFKSSHNYFLSTRPHCHVLESAGSCSSSSSAVSWGEAGRPSTAISLPREGSAGHREPWGTIFCHSGALWGHVLSLQHAWIVACVSTTTFIVGSFRYPLQTLQGVSFAVWVAPQPPERRNMHGSRSPAPLAMLCASGQDGPGCIGKHTVVSQGYVGFPKVRLQSEAGLWHPFTALLFVTCIIRTAIMLENGCFFLNRRKVAARISRIKACLAGNRCRVLKTGRAAAPSRALCVPREQCFDSPEQRLLLWHRVRWTSSPRHHKQQRWTWPALQHGTPRLAKHCRTWSWLTMMITSNMSCFHALTTDLPALPSLLVQHPKSSSFTCIY